MREGFRWRLMPETPKWLHLEDGSTFPRPAMQNDEHYSPAHKVAWQGHENLTRSEALWLASIADSYAYLIGNPEIARKKIPMIRRALAKEVPDV